MSNSLGERLRKARKDRGWTQQELAEKVDETLRPQRYSLYENNKSIPQDDRLEKMAEVLGVSTSWLLYGNSGTLDGDFSPYLPGDQKHTAELQKDLLELREHLVGAERKALDWERRAMRAESTLEAMTAYFRGKAYVYSRTVTEMVDWLLQELESEIGEEKAYEIRGHQENYEIGLYEFSKPFFIPSLAEEILQASPLPPLHPDAPAPAKPRGARGKRGESYTNPGEMNSLMRKRREANRKTNAENDLEQTHDPP